MQAELPKPYNTEELTTVCEVLSCAFRLASPRVEKALNDEALSTAESNILKFSGPNLPPPAILLEGTFKDMLSLSCSSGFRP